MDNLNKFNNSIIEEKNNINHNKNGDIISKKGYKCIGPCYPSKTLFYNPLNLVGYYALNDPLCPIKKVFNEEIKEHIFVDRCNIEDITPDYKNYDIFDDSVQIASTDKLFLFQIYNITNINEVQTFISDTLDSLPSYSQKRLLNSLFQSYKNYEEFPNMIFSKKISHILKEIYHLDIDVKKINKKIIELKKKYEYINIFIYFVNKYSK